MKKVIACIQIFMFLSVFGCRGMLHPPPLLRFYQPRKNPLKHNLAIGRFVDKSFARYPLFISGKELQELFQNELERNRVFRDVFAVNIKKKDDQNAIDEKATQEGADLIMEGEISESECLFIGSNALGIPMYAIIIIFPISFNIKAQTWEGKAEVIIRVRELETDKIVYHRRVEAVAYKNFSIWEERTERQLSRNYVRRMLTPLVLQNLKAAVARDFTIGLKDPARSGGDEAGKP